MTRFTTRLQLFALVLSLLVLPALAQDHNPEGVSDERMDEWTQSMTPGPQHAMLAERVGKYRMTYRFWTTPQAEPMVTEGTAERTMALGGRVLVEQAEVPFMGETMHGIGHTGYDNITGRFWTSWVDNMSTGVSVLYGDWKKDGKGKFVGDVPNPTEGGLLELRIEWRDEGDKQIGEFFHPMPDGGDFRFMEIVYEPL